MRVYTTSSPLARAPQASSRITLKRSRFGAKSMHSGSHDASEVPRNPASSSLCTLSSVTSNTATLELRSPASIAAKVLLDAASSTCTLTDARSRTAPASKRFSRSISRTTSRRGLYLFDVASRTVFSHRRSTICMSVAVRSAETTYEVLRAVSTCASSFRLTDCAALDSEAELAASSLCCRLSPATARARAVFAASFSERRSSAATDESVAFALASAPASTSASACISACNSACASACASASGFAVGSGRLPPSSLARPSCFC
mmetsp:Transcript_3076/g.8514  ORF Transcript_3076/g.8514 Transcript_3076/m.8514 type:complete len:263 (-) Transcript_3076:105-893(-)